MYLMPVMLIMATMAPAKGRESSTVVDSSRIRNAASGSTPSTGIKVLAAAMAAMIMPAAEAAAPSSRIAMMDRASRAGPGMLMKAFWMISKEGAASMA